MSGSPRSTQGCRCLAQGPLGSSPGSEVAPLQLPVHFWSVTTTNQTVECVGMEQKTKKGYKTSKNTVDADRSF